MFDVNKIKEQVGFHIPAGDGQIKICNIKLKQNNLPELPKDYSDLLKMCNGFSNEDCAVFGAEITKHNRYKDIVAFNTTYFHQKPSEWLILGENDFFYFIYNAKEKVYVLADRDSLATEISDTNFAPVLEAILRIE